MSLERGVVYNSSDGGLKRDVRTLSRRNQAKGGRKGEMWVTLRSIAQQERLPQEDVLEFFETRREEAIPQWVRSRGARCQGKKQLLGLKNTASHQAGGVRPERGSVFTFAYLCMILCVEDEGGGKRSIQKNLHLDF